ncbi:MAG: hypothetical protein ACREO9_01165, partial [Lysobacterales bacterium]
VRTGERMSVELWWSVVMLALIVGLCSAWTTERDIRFIWRFAHTASLCMLASLLVVDFMLTNGNTAFDMVLVVLLLGLAFAGPKK